MRRSRKREYERAMLWGMDYTDTAFVKKTTHRTVRRKLNNQTKIAERIVDRMLHYSDIDTNYSNYQKGL